MTAICADEKGHDFAPTPGHTAQSRSPWTMAFDGQTQIPGPLTQLHNIPSPPCASTAAVPEVRPKRRLNAHPVLGQGRACA